MGIRLENLKPEVRTYVQKLRASLQVIYDKYEVANRDELAAKVRKGIVKQEDIDKAIELMTVINDSGRKNEMAGREFEADIIEEEKRALEKFFERKIDVRPLPAEITAKRIEQWKRLGLELHYLPPMEITEQILKLKNWIFKPDLRKHLEKFEISPATMVIPGGWLLVDGRPKPEFIPGGKHMYENDREFLGPVLEDLRGRGLIGKSVVPDDSRFDISPQALDKPEVKAAIAEACGLKPEQISLPRMVEFNILAHLHHPEWDKGIWEIFLDDYKAEQAHLFGCGNHDGGLEDVDWIYNDRHNSKIGFRVVGRFPYSE